MSTLAHQRCFHHATREAVARCLQCRQFFCRECVTEHAGRMVCAACLRQAERAVRLSERPAVRRLLRALQLCLGLVLTWLFFYWTGEALLRLPSAFHDGTVWRGSWLNSP